MNAPPNHGSGDLHRHVGRYYGKYRASVVGIDDADQLGAIDVTVPSVFPDGHRVRARACFPPGTFWVPPIGATVFVEFEAGDPAQPLWVGVWHAVGSPPEKSAVSPPEVRMLHTPSGHEIRFHDREGEERIVVRHRSDAFLSIDEHGSVVVAAKDGSYVYLNADTGEVSIVSKQGHLVSMNYDGVAVASHDGSVVDLGSKVKITSPGAVQVVGKSVEIAAGSIVLGGDKAQLSLMVAEMFAPIFNAHVHPTGVGPSGPAVPPLVPAAVSSKSVKVMP